MNDPTFQRVLQSVLFDNMYDRHVAHRKTGKLNVKTLSKISYSDKLFKKREERHNKNYSIALVVDCSGSMGDDNKYRFAFESAQKLSRHLSSAKVNHAVYGFNIPTIQIKPFNVGYDKNIIEKLNLMLRELTCFWGELVDGVRPYLGHNVDFKKMKEIGFKKGYSHANGGSGYNNDSDAIRVVASDLRKQKGRRIMIMLSDGEPARVHWESCQSADFPKEKYGTGGRGEKELKNQVSIAIKSGIEVHSIGIQTDAVNKYYPAERTCSIYDLPQLYDHIIKIIRLNLKRG